MGMTAFALYMSGSQVQIFSIMMVGMSLYNPLNAILNTNATFAPLGAENVDLTLAKLAFIAVNGLGVAIALYKLSTLGLLPITSADWSLLLDHNLPRDWSVAI